MSKGSAVDLSGFSLARKGAATPMEEGDVQSARLPPAPKPSAPAAPQVDGRTVAMTIRCDAARYLRLVAACAPGKGGRLKKINHQDAVLQGLDMWLEKMESDQD